MAVVSELIEAGLKLKAGGKLEAAIEHFRQLQATYPKNARIMYELAACWSAFSVPEQALPLYRALLALPRGQGLPPRDQPRLMTRLGATLSQLGEDEEALSIFNQGVTQHPSYRPLRAFRIYARAKAGDQSEAIVDAMDLMLESLAPSRWDVFEADIRGITDELRQDAAPGDSRAQPSPSATPNAPKTPIPRPRDRSQIHVEADDARARSFDLEVQVTKPASPASEKAARGDQFGSKAVRINISGQADESEDTGDKRQAKGGRDDASRLRIPLDPD